MIIIDFINELTTILLHGASAIKGPETRATKDINLHARLRAEERPRISR